MPLTNAQLHLQALVAEYPLPEPSEEMLQKTRTDLGLTSQELRLGYRDRVQHLLAELQAALPPIAQRLLSEGRLVVGELGADTPNAHVTRLDGDQFVVVLHSGLFAFLYRIARPLVSAVFRSVGGAQAGIETPELTRVIAEVLWWQQQTGGYFGPEYSISPEHKYVANVLAMRAERFLLAHEIGHVLLAIGETTEEELDHPLDDSKEEHFADQLALAWTVRANMEAEEKSDQMWLTLTYAGAELALQIWQLMEEIGISFVDGIHPPASQRIELLRQSLREWCATEDDFEAVIAPAKVIERAFGEVGQIILNPGCHAANFAAQADSLVRELRGLLAECSKEVTPDYTTFYAQAPALLVRGFPESVLQHVFAEVIGDFEEDVSRNFPSVDKVVAWKRFSQYKLLFGLVEHMPEPLKSVYGATFDRLRGS
ncbi:hypothetical protein P5Y53_19340 [Dyella jiangningensis]|uniref:hypothetical protein n=1 Tax=Dyella jiangningensis TaxID=1379159 RepID=UPI00240F1354|nr:hypothetical protein [Dyella jiangningensis]MDG2539842.1 hypothetical protein [Dyella jiangningensis]